MYSKLQRITAIVRLNGPEAQPLPHCQGVWNKCLCCFGFGFFGGFFKQWEKFFAVPLVCLHMLLTPME